MRKKKSLPSGEFSFDGKLLSLTRHWGGGMPDEIQTDPAKLWERFAQGDGDAFEAVFREYQDDVYGRILRLVRDRGAAEDLTIETFWRIYRSRFRFDPERSFGARAGRIAANVAIGHLKRRRRLGELPSDLAWRRTKFTTVERNEWLRIRAATSTMTGIRSCGRM